MMETRTMLDLIPELTVIALVIEMLALSVIIYLMTEEDE